MAKLFSAALFLILTAGAACAGPLAGSASSSQPAASATARLDAQGGGSQPAAEACRVLTGADVQSTLGVRVQQLPMGSPPPGGGPDASLMSGCTYASTGGTVVGASLFLFKDLPIDSFGTVPGFAKVAGIGDKAYLQAPRILGQKGHVTFQITLVSEAEDPKADDKLKNLARIVASRLP